MPRHGWGMPLSISPLPACPRCSGNAPPRAGLPSCTARPCASIPPLSQPGSARPPSQPPFSSSCHPVPQFPPCRGLQTGGFPVSPSFPWERGGSFSCRFPASLRPTAEPGDCDELRVRGASNRFLAPAERPGAIARLLPARPCSHPAVPRGRCCSAVDTVLRHWHGLGDPSLPLPIVLPDPRPAGTLGERSGNRSVALRGTAGRARGQGVPCYQVWSPCAESSWRHQGTGHCRAHGMPEALAVSQPW